MLLISRTKLQPRPISDEISAQLSDAVRCNNNENCVVFLQNTHF